MTGHSPSRSIRAGVAFCPEDRKAEGSFGELSVRENIVMALQSKRGWLRLLSRGEQEKLADEMIKTLAISTPDAEKPVGQLSGGNQQKVLLARSLVSGPRVLILDEPTRGIDVGAHAEIVSLIRKLCGAGAGAAGRLLRARRTGRGQRPGRGAARSPQDRRNLRRGHHPRQRHPYDRRHAVMTQTPIATDTKQSSLAATLRAIAAHKVVWPLAALALIFFIDFLISPNFFSIRIVEGRLFGSVIDIFYRAVPTAMVALGMAVVIGTKGIDLSVGSIIAIGGAVITWRIHAGDPHLLILFWALGVGLLCGLWNGFLVAVLDIQPIIATLILMVSGRGIGLMINLLYGGTNPSYTSALLQGISTGHIAFIPTRLLVFAVGLRRAVGAVAPHRARHVPRVGRRQREGGLPDRHQRAADHLLRLYHLRSHRRRGRRDPLPPTPTPRIRSASAATSSSTRSWRW